MKIDPQTGVLDGARQRPSPNHDARPSGCGVDLLVIHNISLPPGEFGGDAIDDLFCNCLAAHAHPYFASIAELRVSAHFLIRRDGETVQYVASNRRAWHAGVSEYRGRQACNDFSVGIELEGTDDVPYTEPQYLQLARLSDALLRAYPELSPQRIVGHCDIAPTRKTDPGPAFNWSHYLGLLDNLGDTDCEADA